MHNTLYICILLWPSHSGWYPQWHEATISDAGWPQSTHLGYTRCPSHKLTCIVVLLAESNARALDPCPLAELTMSIAAAYQSVFTNVGASERDGRTGPELMDLIGRQGPITVECEEMILRRLVITRHIGTQLLRYCGIAEVCSNIETKWSPRNPRTGTTPENRRDIERGINVYLDAMKEYKHFRWVHLFTV